ncbi:GGDEF domain-containing protein [Spongiibacter sp. KMU-158]|uniref:GGDEF domain-containing protein n=1 Tax=Spongiibacter pelagi TaxID=2760804 RepID=A0A927GVM6_9GAMM|nr:bifunctional diguanylate cyclase/phosphodiesterase [Spongiibacter pelagi]MBD2858560.1 GGDEF domain-containing protein [Spongiibacter pelagi]
MNKTASAAHSISLFSKLSLLLLLSISTLSLLAAGLIYRSTLASHDSQASESMMHLKNAFYLQLNRSDKELHKKARMLHSKPERVAQALLPNSRIFSNVDSFALLTLDGKINNSIQYSNSTLEPATQTLRWAATRIAETVQPVSNVSCNKQCMQSVFSPVADTDSLININRDMGELLREFQAITGAELLLFSEPSPTAEHYRFYTNPLNRQLQKHYADLSNYVASIVEANKGATDWAASSENLALPLGEQYFQVSIFPLNTAQGLHGVLIADTSELHHHSAQTFKYLLFGVALQIIVTLGILFYVLRPPLQRVEALTNILKLLPQREHEQAAKALFELKRKTLFQDEVDDLRDTMSLVNQSLQTLDSMLEKNRTTLRNKVSDLSAANQFTDTLLNNSPLVIIVHDAKGFIHKINALGQRLTGIGELDGSVNINNYLPQSSTGWKLAKELTPLLLGETQQMQTETPLLGVDQTFRTHLWVHSQTQFSGQDMFLSVGMDISERVEAQESINWLGQHDRITGLLNRNTFIERAADYIQRHQHIQKLQLLMLDIDDFAAFNDNHGFEKGDRLLGIISEQLSNILPLGTLISRTGAGEFLALIHDPDIEDELLSSLTQLQLPNNNETIRCNLTGVIDEYKADIGLIEEWLSNLTSIMSWAKLKNRGKLYRINDEDQGSDHRKQRYQIRDELLKALEDNRLILFFQPIYDIGKQRVSHCECLVRMRDEHGQYVPPNKFLPVAAEFGMLPQIDFAILEMAMIQLRAWQEQGIKTGISINLTAPTMEQSDFQDRLLSLIQQTQVNPEKLIFEIVETDTIENLNAAKKLLQVFKDIGAKIAFDDFGVGFTSFEYVRELPVDFIKIDQSFVRFIQDREEDQKLVKSIVEMSHSLGKKVIAEGVENREAMMILSDLGVEYLQGYYLSRPMPADNVNLNLKI